MNFEDEFDVVPPEGNVFVNHEIMDGAVIWDMLWWSMRKENFSFLP